MARQSRLRERHWMGGGRVREFLKPYKAPRSYSSQLAVILDNLRVQTPRMLLAISTPQFNGFMRKDLSPMGMFAVVYRETQCTQTDTHIPEWTLVQGL